MKTHRTLIAGVAMIFSIACLSGCLGGNSEDEASSGGGGVFGQSGPSVPAGTTFSVRLTSTVNSEHVHVGDSWTGVIVNPVTVGSRVVVEEGSAVQGVVTASQEAKRGSRAMLDLAVRSVDVDGRDRDVDAVTEPVIAGSPRARNLGAIAGGVAAGALIGKAIGGDGKDAAVGGLIGGAAATGIVAKSKGYQVVLKPGTVMTFTVSSRS